MEIVFCETELFDETAFPGRTLDSYNSVLPVSVCLGLARCVFLQHRSNRCSTANLIASADVDDQVKGKASEDAGRAKNFIEDTKDKVKQTANKNADRVDQATDDNDSFVERKAKRDRDRIEQRADEDAARTEKAVDYTKNAIERAVDGIKDVFNN
jgi:uncharacterized protein YjbJ (UPF0337 family)